MSIFFSLLVAIVGALFYLLSADVKRATLGLVAFGCGLLAFLMTDVGPIVSFLGGHR